MPRHEAFGARPRQPVRDRLAPIAVLTLAALLLAGGLDQLVHHFQSSDPRPYRAPSGVALLLAAGVALAAARQLRRNGGMRNRLAWILRAAGLRYAIVGAGLSFLAAVALGPDPNVRYLFRGVVAMWLVAPLATAHRDPRPRLSTTRLTRLLNSVPAAALIVLATLAISEIAMRLANGRRLADTGVQADPLRRLEPGQRLAGRAVNPQGYWDEPFTPCSSTQPFRVALLSGRLAVAGSPASNFVDRIERSGAGVEALNFGLPAVGLERFAAQFTRDAAPCQPDLVVVVVEVARDIAAPRCPGHVFDWRRWSVLRCGADLVGGQRANSAIPALPTPSAIDDSADYLADGCRRMTVCRRPIPASVEQCWQAAFAALDELASACADYETPLALVLAPEDFQLNRDVCDVLRRRSGLTPEQLDLELPQRRLRRYAEERGLTVVDLLPLFRAADTQLYVRNSDAWNEAGHKVAADALADWLASRNTSTILAQAASPGR